MHDKGPGIFDFLHQIAPYATTVFLSTWGGIVNYIQSVRKGRTFSWRELMFDLITSSFAGLLTYYFCLSAGISDTMSAILIAISGHMGTRAISGFEAIHRQIFGKNGENQ